MLMSQRNTEMPAKAGRYGDLRAAGASRAYGLRIVRAPFALRG